MDMQQWWPEFLKRPKWMQALSWLGGVLEPNLQDAVDGKYDAILDKAITERQALIDQGLIGTVIFALEHMVPEPEANQRLVFLGCVRDYDATMKRSSGEKIQPAEWSALATRFDAVGDVTAMVKAYRFNYAFLAARNAGEDEARLLDLYRKAGDAALDLDETERHEFMGHLDYNVARYLLKVQKPDDALPHWQRSAVSRLAFHRDLMQAGAARERLQASAQQIWKLRGSEKDGRLGDFEYFFPGKPIDECGVHRDEFDALVSEFGDDALRKNSAVPKK